MPRRPGPALLALAVLLASPAAVAAGRIASLNLCTDGLLLALVEPERIASLSPLSRDRSLSYLADAAERVPANSGRGESMLVAPAGLVLAGPFDSRARRDLLARQGVEVMTLGLWTSLAQGRRQILDLGDRLDAADRARSLVGSIDDALDRSRGASPVPRTVLVLQRRGYTPGDTSILDELLRHMGLVPHAARLGLPHGGTVPLERLVSDPPDYILTAAGDLRPVDQGSALLTHPALARAVPTERRLFLPGGLAICGGPSTPAAIDALAAEVRRKVR